jgi:hypothetical protein
LSTEYSRDVALNRFEITSQGRLPLEPEIAHGSRAVRDNIMQLLLEQHWFRSAKLSYEVICAPLRWKAKGD